MTLNYAINLVELHNAWRRDKSDTPTLAMANPTELGIAIDTVLIAAKEHETAMMVLHQIAEKPRKTKEQRLAKSCVVFLASMR